LKHKRLICENCGKDYYIEDHDEKIRKSPDFRDRVGRLCPECLLPQ